MHKEHSPSTQKTWDPEQAVLHLVPHVPITCKRNKQEHLWEKNKTRKNEERELLKVMIHFQTECFNYSIQGDMHHATIIVLLFQAIIHYLLIN